MITGAQYMSLDMMNVAVLLFSSQLLEGQELGSCVPGSQGPDSVLDTKRAPHTRDESSVLFKCCLSPSCLLSHCANLRAPAELLFPAR